jgi:hypothetical protein
MKLNKFIFLGLTVLLPVFANGQLITTKNNGGDKVASNIYASAGISVPIGDAISRPNQVNHVIASNGLKAMVGYNYYFNKRWGMGVVGTFASYKAKLINDSYYDTYYTLSDNHWLNGKILIEGIYSPIVKEKWQVEIIQGIGLMYVQKPAYEEYNANTGVTTHKAKDKNWNTNYNIGLKGKFLLNENVGFQVNVNYSYDFTVRTKGAAFFNTIDTQLGVFYNLK